MRHWGVSSAGGWDGLDERGAFATGLSRQLPGPMGRGETAPRPGVRSGATPGPQGPARAARLAGGAPAAGSLPRVWHRLGLALARLMGAGQDVQPLHHAE